MKKVVVMLSSAAGVLAVAGGIAWALRAQRAASLEAAPFANPSKDPSCRAAVGELLSGDEDCDRKFLIYNRNIKTCADQYVMIEEPEPYETVFADEIFEIARCFQTRGDMAKAKMSLEFALGNPDWQMNGPATCSGHASARAELETMTRAAPRFCLKPEQLEEHLKKALPTLSPATLEAYVGSGTDLSSGSYESDDVCPVTLKEVSESLQKALSIGPKSLALLKHEPGDESDRYLIGAPGSDSREPWLVLDFVAVGGCEVLNQILFSQPAP